MSDHNERACTYCGSLLHHEDDCPKRAADKATPCRVCGCLEGEPGLCHAILIGPYWKDARDFRVETDLCVACNGADIMAGVPELARHCFTRAKWADNAASFRGRAVPGAYQLRCHAARMRLKARRIIAQHLETA